MPDLPAELLERHDADLDEPVPDDEYMTPEEAAADDTIDDEEAE